MFRLIKDYFLSNIVKVINLSILTLLVWIIGIVTPYLQGVYLDGLLKFQSKSFIFKFTIILFLLSLANIVISYINNINMTKLSLKMAFKLNNDLLNHVKKVNILRIQKYDSAYLTQRINNDSNALITFFINNYLSIFIKGLTCIFSIYMIGKIDIKLVCVLILFIPLYSAIYVYLKKPLLNNNIIFKEAQGHFFAASNEQLRDIRNIKIDSSFQHYESKLINSFNKLMSSFLNFNRIGYMFSSLGYIVNSIAYVIIFFYGGISIIDGRITIGQLTMITSYFGMIMSGVDYYLNIGKSYQEVKASYTRIDEIKSMPLEQNGENHIVNINSITLENLSFSYGDIKCIENFNYKFKKGNVYSIVGKNGSGKSTLINILLGVLNEGYEGNIYYNEQNIKNLDMYNIRRSLIGVTQQEPSLENETIENNLKNYSNIKDMDLINEWCRKLLINDFIDRLPDGLRSTVDSYSKNMSGGEKQKLSLIKVFLKNPDLIILDEPTSALDVKSIEVLKKEIKEMKENKIIVIVTHSDSLLDICDFTIDVNKNERAKRFEVSGLEQCI